MSSGRSASILSNRALMNAETFGFWRASGGRTVYPYGVQDRPVLGDGRAPTVPDLARAVRLSRLVGLATAALAIGGLAAQRRP